MRNKNKCLKNQEFFFICQWSEMNSCSDQYV